MTAVTLGMHELNASIKRHNIGHLDGWEFVKDVVVLADPINRYQKPLYYWSISDSVAQASFDDSSVKFEPIDEVILTFSYIVLGGDDAMRWLRA